MPALTKSPGNQTYNFTLVLRGAGPLEHLDALFEAGCHDATFGEREGSYYAEFDREASDLADAVESAIAQVEGAVPGLDVIRIEPDELVSTAAIAERTGRTRESIRLLAEHRRGPGNFPPPLGWVNARTRLWRWSDVADWFIETMGDQPVSHSRRSVEASSFIGALNSALELRQYTRRLHERNARAVIERRIEMLPCAAERPPEIASASHIVPNQSPLRRRRITETGATGKAAS